MLMGLVILLVNIYLNPEIFLDYIVKHNGFQRFVLRASRSLC